MPGHPEQSRLIEAVRYGNPDLQMPPKAKLTDEQIADLTEWVKRGAPWPADAGAHAGSGAGPAGVRPAEAQGRALGLAADPARKPPAVKDAAWPTAPIDRFVLAKLEAKGLSARAAGRPADADPPGVLST